jgi:hypothetical protein
LVFLHVSIVSSEIDAEKLSRADSYISISNDDSLPDRLVQDIYSIGD